MMAQNERALYRAAVDINAATPMKPQPDRELAKLHRIFFRIKEAIGSRTKGLSELSALYLFDENEAERLQCDGQCSRFKDGTTVIGLCVGIIEEQEYATMVLLHEIAHLEYWKHDKVFHEYLDKLIKVYNSATGGTMKNDYIGLEEGTRKDSKNYMH